eukprot:scaffold7528_cov142-Ochromonas_danica.AAC.2
MSGGEEDKVILHQKKALAQTIRECQQREERRLHTLSSLTSQREVHRLEERYEHERSLEKTKIENLQSDLQLLEQRKAAGQQLTSAAGQSLSARRQQQREDHRHHLQHARYQPAVSRFYGLETLEDIQFHVDITKKFEKHDRVNQRLQQCQPYDPREDIRKLHLLNEKKQVLEKLISIQSGGRGGGGGGGSVRRGPSSDYSGSSYGGSEVSYATFATSSSASRPHHHQQQQQQTSKVPATIPRLKLAG